ncbi:probable dolichyl pyrophosphate Glc1Man9GlcNAc2 alpha-1,3-glucosyltransferase [Coccinella septempunctata]|uniref:probable dolichyl pyrophosphate Glc1Man9GlcNAc2 alpha-1,3-glucosyltransferase n=1 Tax=Coccinella septempunctata TaxID=41139 RepID=UPI001D078B14|nr:probable dolichyl pyrophosphate Glc1Man9GlcNAc2 alpha-1,3-glucosyltransferase [Coccinella septempunctata]
MIIPIALLVSCLKLLLIPAYHSTDFEVHRNWLAITHSLPIKKWYFENTSEWTLDYPPFFAWFEYLLSFPAQLFDKNMLVVENINYDSKRTVQFQRLSVIFMDLIYLYGVYGCSKIVPKGWRAHVLLILLSTNCGLIMVDHIHFQYNGFMYGILLISISYMWTENYLKSAFFFSVLLNLKHIYLYAAPAYFVYLLRNYCLRSKSISGALGSKQCWMNTIKLGSIVVGVFFVSFYPFLDHIPQVISRLFPLKRGLCHAYWAPNFWALYNVADKAAFIIASKMGFELSATKAAMTGGLVQEYSHSVLPNITPLTSVALTLLTTLPCLIKLWRLKSGPDFIRCIVLCSLTSFAFGYHVHEKAILMAVIPLTLLSVLDSFDGRIFLILSTVGHFSLFPLLFPLNLLIVKSLLFFIYTLFSFYSLANVFTSSIRENSIPLLSIPESLYLLGLGLVYLYENLIHYLLGLSDSLPFLPLMIISVYCSVGVMYCWLRYYIYFLYRPVTQKKEKTK